MTHLQVLESTARALEHPEAALVEPALGGGREWDNWGIKIEALLCPVDFSAASREALQAAATLAERFGARLVVLNVVPPLQPVLGILSVAEFQQSIFNETQESFEEFVREALPPTWSNAWDEEWRAGPRKRLSCEMAMGVPAEEIARAAAREGAGLIVMSSSGKSGWQRAAFGSVASGVLSEAPCPVLIVRPPTAAVRPPRLPPRRVLCPTDWSGASLRAFDLSVSLCQEFDAELCLLHIAPPPHWAKAEVEQEALWKDRQRQAYRRLRMLKKLRPWAAHARFLLHFDADPPRDSARTARGEGADLLVIASTGATGWRRLFIGSTTRRVLRETSCPVLVLPPARGPLPNEIEAEAEDEAPAPERVLSAA